jgi:hypothetical protein
VSAANGCQEQSSTSAALAVSAGFLRRRPGLEPWSGHLGFVEKVALGQVSLVP